MRSMKHVPIRKCAGCGQSFPKPELIRIVRSPEGEISLDFRGKKNGRGVYICKNPACLKKARKAGRIEKSLETAIPDEIWDALQGEIEAGEEL